MNSTNKTASGRTRKHSCTAAGAPLCLTTCEGLVCVFTSENQALLELEQSTSSSSWIRVAGSTSCDRYSGKNTILHKFRPAPCPQQQKVNSVSILRRRRKLYFLIKEDTLNHNTFDRTLFKETQNCEYCVSVNTNKTATYRTRKNSCAAAGRIGRGPWPPASPQGRR